MREEVKRLTPTNHTLRELYLKSGNQCAFPGCENMMINAEGNFIGQVCHIEAAQKGGERFNSKMTNEERRAFGNLMVMCYEHHIITNDFLEYSVSRLQKMKKNHEDKFLSIVEKMKNSVVDYGVATNFSKSVACQKLSDVMEFGCSYDENIQNSEVLNELLNNISDVPHETRSLLAIMVGRSFKDEWGGCSVPLHEIESATGKDSDYILRHIDILKRRNLISEPEADDFNCPFCILCGDHITGWNYWHDIRGFCERTNTQISRIFEDLEFSLFD